MATEVTDRPGAALLEEAPPDGGPGRSTAAVALLVGAVAALVASRPLGDNSLLTHLATGRLILEDGVPTTNPFLFTGTGFPVPSWWWSILLATAESVGGVGAIRLLSAVLAGVLGAVLVRLSVTRSRGAQGQPDDRPPRLVALVVPSVLALLCVMLFLSGRPHLAGFLFLAAALVVFLEERSPWLLVPLFAVWVNVHGSWLYGVVVLGAFAVAQSLDTRRVRSREVQQVGAAVVGVVAGGLLYPTPFELVLLPTRQLGEPLEREALSYYTEWAPVGLTTAALWPLLGLGLLALWGCRRERRGAMALVVVGLVAMGISGLRLVPVAAISLVPFAAQGLHGVGSLRLPAGRPARVGASIGTVVALVAGVNCFLGEGYQLDRYPVESVDWLEVRGLVATPEVRLLSHDYVGNYLEWRYGARANAYVDDRPDAATMVDYVRLLRMDEGWRAAFDRAEPDVVLWVARGALSKELAADEGWIRAAEFDDHTIFCRRSLLARCS